MVLSHCTLYYCNEHKCQVSSRIASIIELNWDLRVMYILTKFGTNWLIFVDVTLTIHLCKWLNDKNLVKPRKTCFLTVNPFPNKPWFSRVCSWSLLKTLREKEKLLITSNFSFSHSVFYSIGVLSAFFYQIWNCPLLILWVWKSPKVVVWERVKLFHV